MEKNKLVDWLEKALNRHVGLQISHPHLGYKFTDEDVAMFKEIKERLSEDIFQRMKREGWKVDYNEIERLKKEGG